jgi:hypothetical protein
MADFPDDPPQLRRNTNEHSTATHRRQPDLIDIHSPVGFLLIARLAWGLDQSIFEGLIPSFVYQEIPRRANWHKDLLESE